MKRREVGAVMMAAAVVLGTATLSGCGAQNGTGANADVHGTEQESKGEGEVSKSSSTHTVTFYDVDKETVLSTQEVESGALPEEYVPQKEGSTFVGWFGTPQMTHRFDFKEEITDDISVFAGFVTYTPDEREFIIVGSGSSPVLLESNWGAVVTEAQTLTKEESETENIYTITMNLNEGDEFQFAKDGAWNNQRGYGYLDVITLDGVEYFKNSGSLGDNGTKRSNIQCAVTGNYTFTLKTYPAEDQYETDNASYKEENKEAFNVSPYDTISWVYNGEQTGEVSEQKVNYYIKGAVVTDWKDVYTEETRFEEKDGIYTLSLDLTKGEEFLFTSTITVADTENVGNSYIRYNNIDQADKESLSFVTGSESANMIAVKDGTYTFTYDAAAGVLKVSCE